MLSVMFIFFLFFFWYNSKFILIICFCIFFSYFGGKGIGFMNKNKSKGYNWVGTGRELGWNELGISRIETRGRETCRSLTVVCLVKSTGLALLFGITL